jgi:TatD DNase family protein
MRLIDTHCHLDFDTFEDVREDLLREAADAGVMRLIDPGTDVPRSRAAVMLAETYPAVWAAVGIHPNRSADFAGTLPEDLRQLAEHPRVVAIGEIGLDYYRDSSPKDVQRRAFEAQLDLATERGLPVIIHNREADADVLDILTAWVTALPDSLKERPGVLHSFSASLAVAERALELGFYLGFTGPITYKTADDLRHIAARIPADRILVETDAPFLTPHPHRGKFPNHPAYVRFTAERIAALRNLSDDEFADQTTANAERLFGLGG